MKKLLFTCLLSLFCCCVQAQNITYVPMLKPGNSWLVYYGFFSDQSNYIVKSKKDSLIKGNKYQLIENELMREDSAQAKVYFYKNGKDSILYDFNLKIGDVLSDNISGSNCKHTVSAIESIKLYDGTPTKKIKFIGTGANTTKYWIMGVGSSKGPTFPGLFSCYTDPVKQFLCFYQGAKVLYSKTENGKCESTIASKDVITDTYIDVYPNPINENNINIELPDELTQCELTMYDIVGNQVLNRNIVNQKETIEVESLQKGMYFMRFADKGKLVMTKKIVKQ